MTMRKKKMRTMDEKCNEEVKENRKKEKIITVGDRIIMVELTY